MLIYIVNIQPTPVKWAVRKGGGALPTVTAITAQGITIMHLFVVQVIGSTTHADTQYCVNKQKKNILNLTSSGDRNYQLILAAHKSVSWKRINLVFQLCYSSTNISAEPLIVPKIVHKKVSTNSVHKKCTQKV